MCKNTLKYIWQLFIKQNRRCALTGLQINLSKNKGQDITASLDRINSSKGYTKDNVQWVHKDTNRLKMAMPQEYFIKLCKLVAKHS